MTFTISQTPDDTNLYLYPSSNSDVSLTTYGETNNYECVDEVWHTPNDDTDYVYNDVPSLVSDLYNLPNHTTESGIINYVKIIARAASDTVNQASNGSYLILGKVGSTTSDSGNNAPLNNSYAKYYYTLSTSPSGATWTWNDIDNLVIGVSCSSPTYTTDHNYIFRPSSDMTASTGIYNHGDSPDYACVDDVITDDDTTYNYSYTRYYERWFVCNIPDHDPGEHWGSINYISIFWRDKIDDNGPSDYVKAIIRMGGTNYTKTHYPLPYWHNHTKTWTTSPTDGTTPFTWDDVDSMGIGWLTYQSYAADNYQYCTQLYATVNCTKTWNPKIKTTQVYAVVNYTPEESTVTLSTPESVSVSHNRTIKRHIFPTGNYAVDDYGRSGKTLTLTGREISSSTDKMQSVKEMCHYGSTVTIAGLPDPNLNTEYCIKDFSFTQPAGTCDYYQWVLTLEED